MYKWLELKYQYNNLRILTQPYQYYSHSTDLARPEDGPYSQNTLCSYPTHVCKLCKFEKAKPRWVIGVINRSNNNFYLVDIDYDLFKQIKYLSAHPLWGKPTEYDITVCLDFDGTFVVPTPKIPLTEKELELQKTIDLNYLTKICHPPANPNQELLDQESK